MLYDINSGLYTPTLSNTTNVAASTAYECQWLRVGSIVIVSGVVDIDPTAAAPTATLLGMSLPIASNLAAAENLGGSATRIATGGYEPITVRGDPTNNRAEFVFLAVDAANRQAGFSFMYRII